MALMGWANTAMATRYQHITPRVRRDVAKRIGGLLWAGESIETARDEDDQDGDGDGDAAGPSVWA
jgi:integrase